jgi:LPS-assembly protein
MSSRHLRLRISCWLFAAVVVAVPWSGRAQTPSQKLAQVYTVIPYRDGEFVLISDSQSDGEGNIKTRHSATGHVLMTFQDIRITCNHAEYDEVTRKGFTSGLTRFAQKQQWLTCSRAEFDLNNQTATFYDAMGYTDQGFFVQGKVVRKTGRDSYEVERGLLTACEEKPPKWGFSAGDAKIRIDRTARLRQVVFRVKGVPIFYFPYLIVPMESKKRSSGFLPFHTGSSTSKGRQFYLGYYQTLGSSADLTLYGDYFSLRGMGIGGIFLARPNEQTRLDIEAFGINDKLHQGGAHLLVDANTQFANGFRAVANVNVSTNFQFRQAFSEGFRAATIPVEQAIVFATRNYDSFSANFSFERNEVLFPARSLVTRKSPSIEFDSLGKPLGKLPLIFYLRAAAEGLSRFDSVLETPRIVQRLDFHPSMALRLPAVAGFSLMPSIGIRETYYGAHLSDDTQPVVISKPMRRQYTDLDVELRAPELERSFHSDRFGDFQHLVEPWITYRWIHGITALRDTIRFDDQDAIADTNELEYGLVNRILRKRTTRPGFSEYYEFLSLKVAQKYYFDPSFGGAFIPGEPNLFYPMNTLTGFSSTGIEHTLSPTTLSLRLNPKPGIGFDARADYDTKLARLRDTSLWATWQRDKFQFAGTYVKANALEPGMLSANHVQGQIRYGSPNARGLSAGVTFSYNLQTKELLNSNSRINYMWDCCGVALEFQQYHLGARTESRFTFSFNLKGIGNFGNLKRPETLF